MQMQSESVFYSLCFAVVLYTISRRFRARNLKLPPGPRGVPILGNVFQLPSTKAWFTFEKWKSEYGPIVSINLAGQTVIVLNTIEVATELLDRRAANYSDRPRNIVAGEYLCRGLMLPLARYGSLWRIMRRASHSALKPSTSSQYHPAETDEAILLALGMLEKPDHWLDNIRRFTASFVTSTVYNMPPLKSERDPVIEALNDMISRFAQATYPGAHLVEALPILDYMPQRFVKWKRDAEAHFHSYTVKFEELFRKVKEDMLKGEYRASFCASLVETEAHHGMNDRESAWLAASLYLAGYETTATVLTWFIYCMVLFPETQRRAQEELDRVVGQSRLPTFSDLEHLPFIHAIIKEVQRWRPVLPFVIPHASLDDDWYEGYFIPKGSICIANVWSMHRDTETFGPDVNEFRPERYLDENGNLKNSQDEGHYTYGFGRRICVGRHLANNSLFIAISILLWALIIEPAKDDNGNLIRPDINTQDSDGVIARPPKFSSSFRPRFADADVSLQLARDAVSEHRSG